MGARISRVGEPHVGLGPLGGGGLPLLLIGAQLAALDRHLLGGRLGQRECRALCADLLVRRLGAGLGDGIRRPLLIEVLLETAPARPSTS